VHGVSLCVIAVKMKYVSYTVHSMFVGYFRTCDRFKTCVFSTMAANSWVATTLLAVTRQTGQSWSGTCLQPPCSQTRYLMWANTADFAANLNQFYECYDQHCCTRTYADNSTWAPVFSYSTNCLSVWSYLIVCISTTEQRYSSNCWMCSNGVACRHQITWY